MKKHKEKIWKGALIGFSVNVIANIISFNSIQITNAIIGLILGVIAVYILKIKV